MCGVDIRLLSVSAFHIEHEECVSSWRVFAPENSVEGLPNHMLQHGDLQIVILGESVLHARAPVQLAPFQSARLRSCLRRQPRFWIVKSEAPHQCWSIPDHVLQASFYMAACNNFADNFAVRVFWNLFEL